MRSQKVISLSSSEKRQQSSSYSNNLEKNLRNLIKSESKQQNIKELIQKTDQINDPESNNDDNPKQNVISLINTDELISKINQKQNNRGDTKQQVSQQRNALNPISLINKHISQNQDKKKQNTQLTKNDSNIFDRIKTQNQLIDQIENQYDTQEDEVDQNLNKDDDLNFNEDFARNNNLTNEYVPLVIRTTQNNRLIRQIKAAPYASIKQVEKLALTTGSKNLIQKSLQQASQNSSGSKSTQNFELEITNIPSQATEQSLRVFFNAFGRVSSVLFDASNQRAVIGFSNQEGQNKALGLANGKLLGDSVITVKVYESNQQGSEQDKGSNLGMLVSDKDIKLVIKRGQNGRQVIAQQ